MKVQLRNPDREVELAGDRVVREVLVELGVDELSDEVLPAERHAAVAEPR